MRDLALSHRHECHDAAAGNRFSNFSLSTDRPSRRGHGRAQASRVFMKNERSSACVDAHRRDAHARGSPPAPRSTARVGASVVRVPATRCCALRSRSCPPPARRASRARRPSLRGVMIDALRLPCVRAPVQHGIPRVSSPISSISVGRRRASFFQAVLSRIRCRAIGPKRTRNMRSLVSGSHTHRARFHRTRALEP